MNNEAKAETVKLDAYLKQMHPGIRQRLTSYFRALEINAMEKTSSVIDEVNLRRAQGEALTYKELVRKFELTEVKD